MAPKAKTHRMSTTSRLYAGLVTRSRDTATWVCGFLFFDHDVGRDMVVSIVRERLLQIPRFRSRVVMRGTRSAFVEVPLDDIDMDYHIVVVQDALPLQTIQDEWVGTVYKHFDFDPSKPWWRITYFPRIADGRALLLTVIAHAIGDGVAQVEVLFRLLDPRDQVPANKAAMGLETQPSLTGDADNDDEDGPEDGSKPAQQLPALADKAGADAAAALRPPPKRKGGGGSTFGPLSKTRIFLGGVVGAFFKVFGSNDTPNALMRKDMSQPSTVKSTYFSESVPLAKIKEMKAKYNNATVNDVLVALLSLTLRAYLQETPGNERVLRGKGKLRAGFPINMRASGADGFRDGSPHNSVGLGAVRFPVAVKSRTALVYEVKRALDKIKVSPDAVIQTYIGMAGIRVLPRNTTLDLMMHMSDQTSGLLSNVAGPQASVHLGGQKVSGLQFLISSTMGLYLGLLSYAGDVSLGICMDSSLGAAEDLGKHWKEQFDLLYEETMAFPTTVPKPFKLARALDCL